MIVVDTSALISLATADTLELVLAEFETHTTETVIEELEATAAYTDVHGTAATTVLENRGELSIQTVEKLEFETSRIDRGEASCATLSRELEADFLITDDLRALPELQNVTAATVAISPLVLKALVKRGVLENEDARSRLDRLAEDRNWLEAPIYRRAQALFSE
ncbi:hypothetical protein ACLI4R_14420 [Natrialbaceae archaeon A-chndr2]